MAEYLAIGTVNCLEMDVHIPEDNEVDPDHIVSRQLRKSDQVTSLRYIRTLLTLANEGPEKNNLILSIIYVSSWHQATKPSKLYVIEILYFSMD